MSAEYRRNHYVPVWYQKRFIAPQSRSKELSYLDLKPPTVTDGRGVRHSLNSVRRRGPKHCFVEDDLYTVSLGSIESTEIEQLFFGVIDSAGRHAVDRFAKFQHSEGGAGDAFLPLIQYMSTQKLRTPKGLAWLRDQAKTSDHNKVL